MRKNLFKIAASLNKLLLPSFTKKKLDMAKAESVKLRKALNDAINSPKGVVPVSAEPFWDGKQGRVKI